MTCFLNICHDFSPFYKFVNKFNNYFLYLVDMR
nr:MAG TPA: hypothetical protein [Caudoviricetes sp.]